MARKKVSSKRASQKRKRAREVKKHLKIGQMPKDLNRTYLLLQLKYHLSRAEADRIIESLSDEDFDYVTAYPIAKSYSELMKDIGPYVKNLSRELNWIARFLNDYNDSINDFVRLERNYSRHFLLGQYHKAKEILNEIDLSISYSAWSLQQKLFVAELEKGFVANKDMLSGFLSEEISTVASFLANYTSIRVEKNLSPSQYEEFVDNYTEGIPQEIAQYVHFKVDYFRTFVYKDPELILHIDGRFSIIDRYITFKELLKLVLSQHNHDQDSKVQDWKKTAMKLVKVIDDPELRLICNTIDGFRKVSDNDKSFLEIFDLYSINSYYEVITKAEDYLISDPSSYHIILIYCKSLLNQKKLPRVFNIEGSILDSVVTSLYGLLEKGESFSEEIYSNIFKLAHQLGNHPLAIGLCNQLNEEIPFRSGPFAEIDFFRLFMLNSTANNPALHQLLPQKKANFFLAELANNKQDSPTIRMINKISHHKKITNIGEFSVRELKYHAIVTRNRGDFSLALEIYDDIMASAEFKDMDHSSHFVLDILVGKFSCYVESKQYGEALELSVGAIIRNFNYKERFYNPILLKKLIETDDQALQANICLPIYLAFYKRIIESYDLYVAYDNYLAILGYDTPKDLIGSYESFDEKDLTFLKIVCTHDVLHSSPYFENQEELDLERIDICGYLLDKLKPNDEIDAERSDLLRKILVRKGIKQINYSKIYVDIEGLKDTLQKELKENFNRNVEIASLPIDQLNKIIDSVGNMIVYYVDKQDKDEELTKEDIDKVKFTSYNRFLHFSEAFLKVRDKFIFDKDHGLDTYLSMRIRHGTLLGQIRSVFETHHLITVRNEIDNEYLPNDNWLSKFDDMTEDEIDQLNTSLNSFSESIDVLAETLKLETIQIISEKTKFSKGLFDFSYNQNDLLTLFTKEFGSIKDYDVFIDHVVEELWKRTEKCLIAIKRHLSDILIPKIESIFEDLEKNIEYIKNKIGYADDYQEFINTIRDCRTAIVVEIGNISEWFNRSSQKIIEEFDLSVLAQSSINTLQTINPFFKNADIKFRNTCKIIFDGNLFQHFTHIIYYLLDNAIKHSKLASDELWVNIEIQENGKFITLSVSNNLFDEETYLEKLKLEILAAKSKIENEITYDRINKEGKTGFPKIKKTLRHDLKRKDFAISLELERLSDNTPVFICQILFEIEGLPVKA